jgi:hypothetical protein
MNRMFDKIVDALCLHISRVWFVEKNTNLVAAVGVIKFTTIIAANLITLCCAVVRLNTRALAFGSC